MLHDGHDAAAEDLLRGQKETGVEGDDDEGGRRVVQHESAPIQKVACALESGPKMI